LTFDKDLLKVFQDHFPSAKVRPSVSGFKSVRCRDAIFARLLLAVFAEGHHLNPADHHRTSRSWANSRN
jgi:hypothetical protein